MASSAAHPLGSLQSPEVSFGTDGLRGRVGTAITPALALQVGFWCGHVLPPDGPVLIGMDSRCSGSMVVASGLAVVVWGLRWLWPLQLLPGWVVLLVGLWALLELAALLLVPQRWN